MPTSETPGLLLLVIIVVVDLVMTVGLLRWVRREREAHKTAEAASTGRAIWRSDVEGVRLREREPPPLLRRRADCQTAVRRTDGSCR